MTTAQLARSRDVETRSADDLLSRQEIGAPPKAALPSVRLKSLDVFRGITIAGMLLVNNPGSGHTYEPLEHAAWNGWTPTDLIFPFFLFIVGVATPFSLGKRGQADSKAWLFLHILARGLSLFVLGELCYSIPSLNLDPAPAEFVALRILRVIAVAFLVIAFVLLLYPWKSKRAALIVPPIVAICYLALLLTIGAVNQHAITSHIVGAKFNFGAGLLSPDRLRIPGVLQRIGVCYAVAASLALLLSWRGIAIAIVTLLALYSAAMLLVPVPSKADPSVSVRGHLDRDDNLAHYLDVKLLGRHVYGAYADPEGILSTIPAIATTLLGILAGLWLRTNRDMAFRCAGMLAFGVLAIILGVILDSAVMPINKQIWSTSFVVFTAGCALLGLGACFYIIDMLGYQQWSRPFEIYGLNAIFAFVLSAIVGRTMPMLRWTDASSGKLVTLRGWLGQQASAIGSHIRIGSIENNQSLTYAVGYVLFFLLVMWILYRLKIFIKV